MANYERTLKSSILDSKAVSELNADEFRFYVYIHCGSETSDISLFYYPIRRMAYDCNINEEQAKQILESFIEKGLCKYDYDTGEILVLDYFEHNAPKNTGVCFKMYEKDFAKVKSKTLLSLLAEHCLNYKMTICFLSAMDTVFNVDLDKYTIHKTTETMESVRSAAARGRAKISNKNSNTDPSCNIDTKTDGHIVNQSPTTKDTLLDRLIKENENQNQNMLDYSYNDDDYDDLPF